MKDISYSEGESPPESSDSVIIETWKFYVNFSSYDEEQDSYYIRGVVEDALCASNKKLKTPNRVTGGI